MTEPTQDLLVDVELPYADKIKLRKKSVPLWIKIFSWIFLILGLFIPFVFAIGLLGGTASLALYGLETTVPYSLLGILITLLFVFKALVAFGLLWGKDWGANAAFIDGIIGCLICLFVMISGIIDSNFNFRLELIALVPYVIKFLSLRKTW